MNRVLKVLALAAAVAAAAGCDRTSPGRPQPDAANPVKIGGPFSLIDTAGRPVTEKSLLGKPSAIFFGFTYCPEVCPTTLAEMTGALKALGPDADKLNVVFVSVDPERDTPEQMKLYLSNFDPRIQGFTGTVQAVASTAEAYRVYYKKVPVEGGTYTIDHSSAVYLFDRRGEFVEPLSYGMPHALVVERLRKLIAGR
jgi:protein SCO1/2